MTDVIVIFHCGLFFALSPPPPPPLPPNSPKKYSFRIMRKSTQDIITLLICTKNFDQMMYGSWDMVCDRLTDRQMDGWTDEWTDGLKKWHIKVGAPTKKQSYHRHIQVIWETSILAWAPKLWCPKNTFQVCFFQNGSNYFKMAQNKKMETEEKNNETKRSKWQKKLSIKVFSFI